MPMRCAILGNVRKEGEERCPGYRKEGTRVRLCEVTAQQARSHIQWSSPPTRHRPRKAFSCRVDIALIQSTLKRLSWLKGAAGHATKNRDDD